MASSGGRAFEMTLETLPVRKVLSAAAAPFSASLGGCQRCARSALLLGFLTWCVTLLAATEGRTAAASILGIFAAGLTILYIAHLVARMRRGTVSQLLLGYGATRAEASTISAALDLDLARHGRNCRTLAEAETLHIQFNRLTAGRRRLTRVSLTDEKGCVAAVSLKDDGSWVEWRPPN